MVKKFIIAIEAPIPIFGNHKFVNNNEVKLFMFRIGLKKIYSSKEEFEREVNSIFIKKYDSIEEAESVIENYLKDKPDNYEYSLSIIPIYTKN